MRQSESSAQAEEIQRELQALSLVCDVLPKSPSDTLTVDFPQVVGSLGSSEAARRIPAMELKGTLNKSEAPRDVADAIGDQEEDEQEVLIYQSNMTGAASGDVNQAATMESSFEWREAGNGMSLPSTPGNGPVPGSVQPNRNRGETFESIDTSEPDRDTALTEETVFLANYGQDSESSRPSGRFSGRLPRPPPPPAPPGPATVPSNSSRPCMSMFRYCMKT